MILNSQDFFILEDLINSCVFKEKERIKQRKVNMYTNAGSFHVNNDMAMPVTKRLK